MSLADRDNVGATLSEVEGWSPEETLNMDIGNFLEKHWLEIIFAIIAAILVPLFWEPIKKFFVSIFKLIRKLSADKRFEQKYEEWLINKYRFLNVRGIKAKADVAIELERVFISLKAKRPSKESETVLISIGVKRLSKKERRFYPIQREEEELDRASDLPKLWLEALSRGEFPRRCEERETERTYELKDLFNLPQKRFIIIGKPGSGKTTLLNYLALKFARKGGEELFGIENEKLPIFINLRNTIEGSFLDVRKFAENYSNYIDCPHIPPQDFFEKRLEEGRCIILLDGLDEVTKDEERAKVAKWMDELATIYPKNTFIATSRSYGYETAPLYNDFLELHILDFTPEQVEEFIRYWTKAVEIKAREDESEFTLKEAKKKADDLLKAIKETPKIEVLTVNPLLLTIVSLVHRYRATLPKRRVELYEECCDVLLGHWDIAKGIAGELQPRQKRTILQPLAFHLHREGLREEKREKFIELLENELPKIGVSKDKATQLLDNIRYRCGILLEIKPDFFGFAHLTFQEFLTARYILDNDLENFLVAKRRDKYWLEVTLLYCGMKDTTNLFNKILKEKEDLFHTNLFLAGRCLAESLSVNPDLRAQITQKLFDIYWDKNEFGKSRETTLEILKEVKDQKIISNLLELLKDKDSDVSWRAAYALGQIQAKEAVLPLLELLKDKHWNIIERAADALGQIQAKEAVLPLLELLKDEDEYVRGSAADALGQIQAKEAVLPLLELLKDEDGYVRGRAASALGQIQAKEAVLPLLELLKDKDIDVRERAALALGRIQAKEAVLPLLELLKDKESDVREHAAYALGEIPAKEAVLPLLELLKDKESDVRGLAASALGQIQAKEAVLPLLELLKDKESDVRRLAASALGKMQAEEAILPLAELLKDRDSHVRGNAADALGKIGDKKAIESLKQLLNDWESSIYRRVRDSAFNALKEISERTGIPIYKD